MKNGFVKAMNEEYCLPFVIGIEPMKRLLIANFDNDPVYEAIEPQLFDDDINGKGMRVLVYRKDGMVDVYHQSGVRVDLETFSIGAGLGLVKETEIEPCVFQIDEHELVLHICFQDKECQKIEMKIDETHTSKKRLSFLAPVGNDIIKPKQLFLAYMKDFDFVVRDSSILSIKIDGRPLKPQNFPLLRNGRKVFFARYSNNPIVGTLNPPMKKCLQFRNDGSGQIEVDGMIVKLRGNLVASISRDYNGSKVSLEFPHGVPNLLDIREGSERHGSWFYFIDGHKITGGDFLFKRHENMVDAQILVTQPWGPQNLPMGFQIFTLIVKFFRKWPISYCWKGRIDLTYHSIMQQNWFRV